jgi:membrane protease YdiL (CAAX protease family)
MAEHSLARHARGAAARHDATHTDAPQRWDVLDLLVAVGLSVLALLVVGIAVARGLAHVLPDVRAGSSTAAMITLVAGFASYVVAVVPLVLLLRARHGTTLRDLGWTRPTSMQVFWLVPPITAGVLVLTGMLGAISRALMPGAANPQCHAQTAGLNGSIVLAAVLVSVIAPIAEETLFRGFLYRWFEQRMAWSIAVPLSALVFAGAHRILLLLLPLFGVGVVLALVYRSTRSIWPGAAVHALNNAVALMAIFYGLGGC